MIVVRLIEPEHKPAASTFDDFLARMMSFGLVAVSRPWRLVRRVQCRTNPEIGMARCLLGVFVLTAGLVALASAAKETRSAVQKTAATSGNRLRERGVVAVSGTARTLLLPAPAFDLRFSLN
jgi:hypothetical protein